MQIAMLLTYIERLRELAAHFDHALSVRLGPPVDPTEVAEAESFSGAPLPESYKAFLDVHNGMRLELLASEEAYEKNGGLFDFKRIHINSTREIVTITKNFRDYLDGYDIAPPSFSPEVRQKAYRCIDLAAVTTTSDMRVAYSIDEPRPNNEFAIVEAEFATMMWLDYLEHDVPRILVANSLDEFLGRSLESMLSAEHNFRYWHHDLPY